MKKILKVLLKIIIGLILVIIVALFTIPVIFKKKIKTEVQNVINTSVNAKVAFTDYKLGFFRNFPNFSFTLMDMSVVGTGKFEGDTLAAFKSFDLVFNLKSIFAKTGYEVKSMVIDRAFVNGVVLKDGTANWDITKPSATPASPDTVASAPKPQSQPQSQPQPQPQPQSQPASSGGSMKILLRKFEIKNSSISYSDQSMPMNAKIENLNFSLAGNMSLSGAGLKMSLSTGPTTVIMDSVRYLNKARIDSKMNVLANLDSMKFTLRDNYFSINELTLRLTGIVAMPGNNIVTNLRFGTDKTSFKTLLSLVPAIYMKGYEDLKASGVFSLSGSVSGIYSDADSTLPDVKLNLSVNDGLISYPALPEKISNININTDVFVDGKNLDKTTVSLDKFHFELAGNPFDMSFFLKTPMSDPDFAGSMKGRIDLAALSKAVPMDSISLSGVVEMAVSMAGKMSMIEKEQYDSFKADGTIGIKNMIIAMKGYPRIDIKEVAVLVTPAATRLQKADMVIEGTSDVSVTGTLENYIPYLFRNETVKGNLAVHSNLIDATQIMNSMSSSDTVSTQTVDTVGLVIIAVPRKIDFSMNVLIEKFSYDNIKADKFKGKVIVNDGILSLRETGMNILGGSILMNADYDTRDTTKPVMKADFSMKDIGIKDAYNMFQIVQKMAPSAKGLDGRINAQLEYKSLLGGDMMPVLNTIEGSGKLHSDQIQLVESKTFDKIKNTLKLGDNYSNTFKDVNISFTIRGGRVYVTPFDVKLGNIKMNVGGDQGLDQTLNYLVKTEIPRSDLGSTVNSLIDNLSAQAASYGIAYKPADVLKVNVKVTGTFANPQVMPAFGNASEGSAGKKETAKETVKQIVGDNAEKAKEKARAEAEAQGDKLIKEAEEKSRQLHEEALKAAEKVRQEAAAQGQNLIKEAESKNAIAKAIAQRGADALKKEGDKRADQIVIEADNQGKKLVDEAKAKKEELIKKI